MKIFGSDSGAFYKLRTIAAILILLGVFVVVFAVQNMKLVDVQLLAWELTLPRSMVLFSVLAIGMVIGWGLKTIHRHME